MKRIKVFLAVTALLLIAVIQTGCKSNEPVSKEGFYLDTVCSVTIYHMDEKDAQAAIETAFNQCASYEAILSKTAKGSDIYDINHAKGKPVTVHEDTLKVLKKGVEYGELSNGAFDITIGAVSNLWDFGSENPKLPSERALKKALKTVDYRQVDISGKQVRLKKSGAQLDLGGIAKGYIADRMAESLEALGVKSAIINLGGNIVTIGEKQEGLPWTIGIERPYSDRSEILGSVEMKSGSIVTSGVYERKFTFDGKLYHHILDAKTGYPVKTDLEAVTIKGGKGRSMECDGLSTICLMLGTKESRKVLKKLKGKTIEAAFIDKEDNIVTTEGMVIKENN